MYRPLYWIGKDGAAAIDPQLSLAEMPKWDSDTSLTIKLKPFKWSNGEELSSRNVIFSYNLIKANKAEWFPYSPGSIPDNIKSIKAVDAQTLSITLTKRFNQDWFVSNQLSLLTPWPLAWDITKFPSGVTGTSGTLPVKPTGTLPDTTTAGAKAVASFLKTQAADTSSYAKSPIWSIVNGPWKLTQLTTNGLVKFDRNDSYSGPRKNQAQTFTELPYTSTAAEYSQLLSSQGSNSLGENTNGQLSVGYIPPENVAAADRIRSNGYNVQNYYNVGYNFIAINLQNPTVGGIFSQLYMRQALQYLIDQKGWVKTFFSGSAEPSYGPVPVKPASPYVKAFDSPQFPFSTSKAKELLEQHGWNVRPDGVTTCLDPSKCGEGIDDGTKLEFKLVYKSGDKAMENMISSFASNASEVGIKINASGAPFSQVTGAVVPICKPHDSTTKCGWQMQYWGGVSGSPYPSGETAFATGATGNYGGYSDSQMDKLINATVFQNAPGTKTMDSYVSLARSNLPAVLWMPHPAQTIASAKGLANYHFNPFGFLTPEMW